MHIVCTDLEGVLVPEIWIHVSQKTGIEALRLTTRDIPDYDELMRRRLGLLDKHGLKLKDITDVIAGMEPLAGAREFLDWLREQTQVIIVSDTYIEFAKPLMAKLGWPTLFCHTLSINAEGAIVDYHLRQPDAKRHVVESLKRLNFEVIAMGDSYNDISMLKAASHGILFRPPQNVVAEFPQFPVNHDYRDIKTAISRILG
ncbi:MAG: bifunctional phosphoserine phosphatase/homoserine phosphotransferase ThrH [Desulfatitalea sp.]|nr:bifunctional phosphoserine phosphatase/homoserine phosphotransferase ThrH [Desulfatitalea sp.]NNK00401.1 bifunctional phosphoserine phosphatase/homoserine phosphotransferase ThrH [Desulfatitalea sp.]